MALEFATIPAGVKIQPKPFTVSIPEEQLEELKALVRFSKTAPPTYEGSQEDGRLGVPSSWLANAKEEWKKFDWREAEKEINSFPQFTYEIEGLRIHFVALFSEKQDAKPIAFFHGWPGSFLEFLPLLTIFRKKYEPSTLPYHLIVPSLPGYTFSSGPPVDRDFTSPDAARILNQVMVNLGFESGYVAQGGDVGSKISRVLGAKYDSCKAVHLNFLGRVNPPKGEQNYSAVEQAGLKRAEWFNTYGTAYYMDHATRPSTISHILSTNPVALLIWIGERFLDWPDKHNPIPLRTILTEVTLYWLTETFPRSIYTYRETYPPPPVPLVQQPEQYIHKPFGFSYFPLELIPTPRSWVELTGDLVFWKEHIKGGHFAALECPQELADDIVEFVEQVWPN
ncbi:hypothetical protein EYB25_000964 [Talaromyces marneffei]|uniref:Epoxide hydrolase, putative n=1 Tax=Talaromyces marneffei (strain ATCC 18224 / CBS 334.59 / QM 7333) TaxID=441960 RepID=B6Q3K5_TALMQ|nr:uncharacterized protein EYB26_001367 [Talaromyces marneffei]EEA28094.1 epoxide hydrolase, putative [Talaromyces marneffei ATCC 18224]KAE8556263.1 hypothetical protein EYB25_000964 [Talaromyces marneffei]QGA13717.1 hypothetical protein EYB26_001367 [Talaromyces marneffei]